MKNFDHYYSSLLTTFSHGTYFKEIQIAKQEYFEQSGMVHEDDKSYDQRIKLFIDWYLFERELQYEDICPAAYFLFKNKHKMPDDDTYSFENITSSIHGLFWLKKVRGENVYIVNLFSKKGYVIVNSDVNQGFTKGDIFEARIIPFNKNYIFSKGFCFHPPESRTFILSEIRKIKNMGQSQHTKLLFALAKMRLTIDKYPHIDIKEIYTNKNVLKI